MPVGWCSRLPLNQEVLPTVVGRQLEASWALPGLPRFAASSGAPHGRGAEWQETSVYAYERCGLNQADPSGGRDRTPRWDFWASGTGFCPIQTSPGPDLPWAAVGPLRDLLLQGHQQAEIPLG